MQGENRCCLLGKKKQKSGKKHTLKRKNLYQKKSQIPDFMAADRLY